MPSEPDAIAAQSERMSPKIFGGDRHIKLPRLAHNLHGGIVNVEMGQLNIRELFPVQRNDLLAPQHACFEYVGLVDRADLISSRSGQFECGPRHPSDLTRRILLGVETTSLAIRERLNAARLAEIDTARELPDNDKVDAA